MIELSFADGQLAALARYKLAWPTPTHPVVQDSALLRARETPMTPPAAQEALAPPATPLDVTQAFNAHEQVKTRLEPRRKLSAEGLCTTCRRERHYGPCHAPKKIPTKAADFNLGMTGDDPSNGDNPSTSPHYHSATSDSALARARDGRPADEQAATGFADLFRHLGITSVADEPGRMYGGLNKVALWTPQTLIEKLLLGSLGRGALAAGLDRATDHNSGVGGGLGAGIGTLAGGLAGIATGAAFRSRSPGLDALVGGMLGGSIGHRAGRYTEDKLSSFMLTGGESHSMHERRGPSPNPYEERLTLKSPPVGWGDEGPQRTRRAFDQIDGAVDTTNIGGGFGDPQPGPAALG